MAGQILLTALCAYYIATPQKDPGLWSLDFYKAGISATEAAQSALAQNQKEEASIHLLDAQRNLEMTLEARRQIQKR